MADPNNFQHIKEDVLRKGGFFVHFYFDMHSSDPQKLQSIMVGFVTKLTKEPGVRMAVAEIEEPIAHQDLHSTTSRVSLLVTSFNDLSRLSLTYAPIAIEVEEPLDITLSCGEIQQALMNASSISQELTQHILTKGLSPEEKQSFERQMAQRAELGRRLVGQTRGDSEAADSASAPASSPGASGPGSKGAAPASGAQDKDS